MSEAHTRVEDFWLVAVALAFSLGRLGGAGDGVDFIVRVNGNLLMGASVGDGPVDTLNGALRDALQRRHRHQPLSGVHGR